MNNMTEETTLVTDSPKLNDTLFCNISQPSTDYERGKMSPGMHCRTITMHKYGN